MNYHTTIGQTCGHCGRIDCQVQHRIVSATSAPALCEFCKRPIAACDADKVRGCGLGKAGDPVASLPPAPPPKKTNESWRDRPPLL